MEEPSGVPEAWREREGREFFSSDAVTAITAKDVTTTERSGNAKALLHITILLSEALPSGKILNANANGMTFALLLYANSHDLLRRTHWRAFPIERDCERMVYPLAVERGEGVVVAGR